VNSCYLISTKNSSTYRKYGAFILKPSAGLDFGGID
jgi:hypothetical protein